MISGVYKSKVSKIVRTIRDNGLVFVLIAIFSAGLVFGTVIMKNDSPVIDKAVELFSEFVKLRGSQSVFARAYNSLLSNLILAIPLYIFGLCALGLPIVLSIPFIKGCSSGIITAYFYITYGLNGLGHCILVIFPGAIIAALTLILLTQTSLIASTTCFRRITVGDVREIKFMDYNKQFLSCLCFMLLSSLIDGVLNKIFSNIFIA